MSAPVRVSLDATAVPERPAGAGRYVVELAAALSRRPDVDLTVAARRGDRERWSELGAARVVDEAPRPRPLRLLWEQVALPARLARLGPDVHHAPHYTMPESARVPTVVTVHDLTFFDHPEWHERTKVALFRRAVRVAAVRAAALVCVSRATAARLEGVVAARAPVHVVPHGVDHARFRPLESEDPGAAGEDAAVLARLGVRPPYVAFVGTLEPRKDVPTLVHAFDRMAAAEPELTLVLAGAPGWGTRAVEAALARATHRDRVRRLGYVRSDDVPALLRGAAAVAYPSLAEGFGLPALEALACGALLVTTAGTAMEEVVGDAALLVPPGDAEALAGALTALVAGEGGDWRRRRGPEVAAAYTWEASAAAHAGVYRSVS